MAEEGTSPPSKKCRLDIENNQSMYPTNKNGWDSESFKLRRDNSPSNDEASSIEAEYFADPLSSRYSELETASCKSSSDSGGGDLVSKAKEFKANRKRRRITVKLRKFNPLDAILHDRYRVLRVNNETIVSNFEGHDVNKVARFQRNERTSSETSNESTISMDMSDSDEDIISWSSKSTDSVVENSRIIKVIKKDFKSDEKPVDEMSSISSTSSTSMEISPIDLDTSQPSTSGYCPRTKSIVPSKIVTQSSKKQIEDDVEWINEHIKYSAMDTKKNKILYMKNDPDARLLNTIVQFETREYYLFYPKLHHLLLDRNAENYVEIINPANLPNTLSPTYSEETEYSDSVEVSEYYTDSDLENRSKNEIENRDSGFNSPEGQNI